MLNILYFNHDFPSTLPYTVSYRVILHRTFLFIARCIVPNWRRKRPRKVYRIARGELVYVIAILHVDGRRVQGIPQTARFLRESGRERRKGKLYSVGRSAEKSQIRGVYQIQRRQRRTRARPVPWSPGLLRSPLSCPAQSTSSWTRYQPRRRAGTNAINGGRIVVDLWPLILCPDSGIAPSSRHHHRRRPAISHPFEKPRAEFVRGHSFILRNAPWIAAKAS